MQTEKEYLTSREIISLRSDSVGEYPSQMQHQQ